MAQPQPQPRKINEHVRFFVQNDVRLPRTLPGSGFTKLVRVVHLGDMRCFHSNDTAVLVNRRRLRAPSDVTVKFAINSRHPEGENFVIAEAFVEYISRHDFECGTSLFRQLQEHCRHTPGPQQGLAYKPLSHHTTANQLRPQQQQQQPHSRNGLHQMRSRPEDLSQSLCGQPHHHGSLAFAVACLEQSLLEPFGGSASLPTDLTESESNRALVVSRSVSNKSLADQIASAYPLP